MKDKDFESHFPWTLIITISIICYLAFTSFLKLLNKPLPSVFFGIVIIILTLGFLSGLILLFFEDRKSSLLDNPYSIEDIT